MELFPRSQRPPVCAATGSSSALLDAPSSTDQQTGLDRLPPLLAPSPRRILLVDRDGDTRRLARCFLESEGHLVFSCGDPVRAVRTFCYRERIDLLLADLDMPYLSGIQLAREAVAVRPLVPVVITSAEEPAPAIRGYIAQRGWQYLPKPYDIPLLLEIVRELVERPAKRTSRQVATLRGPASLRPFEVA